MSRSTTRRTSTNTKITLGVLAAAVVALLVALLVPWGGHGAGHDESPAAIAARADSHRLSSVPDGKVTFVEFLDFECEACRGVYPSIEQIRAEYGDRVSFVIRYFPIQSHYNAMRAARAVEAAAQQGKLEAMYRKMYETQEIWGEKRVPADSVFRRYAMELGLDMAAYDRVYAAPETVDRIEADAADGTALGVEGTPTFFLNGEKLQPETVGDLTDALDAALAR